jgi:hypothetical protein
MKHIICVEVTEARPEPGVPFDPSAWTFQDLADAYAMGLITCIVSSYEAQRTPAEQRAHDARQASHQTVASAPTPCVECGGIVAHRVGCSRIDVA